MIYTTTLFALCLITETAFAAQEDGMAFAAEKYGSDSGSGDTPRYLHEDLKELSVSRDQEEEKSAPPQPAEAAEDDWAMDPLQTPQERRYYREAELDGYSEHSYPKTKKDEARIKAMNSYKEDIVTPDIHQKLQYIWQIREDLDRLLEMNRQRLPKNLPRVRIRNAPDQRLNGIYRPVLAEPIGDSKGAVTVVRYEISSDDKASGHCSRRCDAPSYSKDGKYSNCGYCQAPWTGLCYIRWEQFDRTLPSMLDEWKLYGPAARHGRSYSGFPKAPSRPTGHGFEFSKDIFEVDWVGTGIVTEPIYEHAKPTSL